MNISISLGKRLCLPALFLCVLTIASLFPTAADAYELYIGTDKAGTFSYFAGKVVCRTLHKRDQGMTCRTVPAENYTDSLTNVLSGSLDMALVNSKMVYDAYHGAGHFQYVSLDYDQLRLMTPLYRTPVSLLVRRDANIAYLGDLAGKRVNASAPFSLQNIIFKELMNAEGWNNDSFSLVQNLSETNAHDIFALRGGSIQATLHIGMHPDITLEQVLNSGSIELVGLNGQSVRRLIDSNSGFYNHQIPAGTYPGYPHAIDTLSLETLLITSADADDETTTLILEAIFAAKEQLQFTHPAFLQVKTDIETLNAGYLHPHPASILFFQTNQNRL